MCEVSWQRKSEWRMLSALSRAHTLAAKTNIDMKYKWIRGALGSAVKEECHLKLMLQRWWKNKIESLIFSPFDNQRADTGPLPAVSHHPSRGLKFTGHPCGIHHFSTTFEEMFTPKKWFIAPERKTTTFLWSGGGGVVIFSVLFIYSFISILILALSSHIRAGWFKTWGGSSPSRTCTHTHTHTHTYCTLTTHQRGLQWVSLCIALAQSPLSFSSPFWGHTRICTQWYKRCVICVILYFRGSRADAVRVSIASELAQYLSSCSQWKLPSPWTWLLEDGPVMEKQNEVKWH